MSSKARGLADLGNAFDDGAITGTNMVINGAMQVAQRGTSVTGGTSGYNTADRWYLRRTASGVTFDSDVTGGVLTCENPSSAAGFDLRHGVEWEDRFYGKTMTLTFTATTGSGTIHVDASVVDGSVSATTSEERCHLQGTTTDITDYEGPGLVKSGNNYKITFDVPSDADVSFTPDMLRIAVGNTSASSQSITLANVQLEVGDTATSFEHRSYGDELARCQRYFYRYTGGSDDRWGVSYSSNNSTTSTSVSFPVTMRSVPTGVVSSNGLLRVRDLDDGTGGDITPSTLTCLAPTKDRWKIAVNAELSNAAQILAFSTKLDFDAEL
jgi:hypothetical protein